ncbi:MAG: hypothetical protein V1670_01935 [Candidatus Omnitrophota bacterium]
MKKIIVLLCLGLLGCATAGKENKTSPVIIEKPALVDETEINSIISVFSEAIKKAPNYGGAYYNRAVAYFYKKNYAQCWQDVHKAESLGSRFSADFMESLKKASHREK